MCADFFYFLMKLMSPLRSTRAFFTFEISSSRKLRRIFSSTSVRGDMVAAHRSQNEVAIFNDYFGQTLDEATEPMRVKGDESEKAMQQHEDEPAAERGEKRRAAVDGA